MPQECVGKCLFNRPLGLDSSKANGDTVACQTLVLPFFTVYFRDCRYSWKGFFWLSLSLSQVSTSLLISSYTFPIPFGMWFQALWLHSLQLAEFTPVGVTTIYLKNIKKTSGIS